VKDMKDRDPNSLMKWDEYIFLRNDYVCIGVGVDAKAAVTDALTGDNVTMADIQQGCIYKTHVRCKAITPIWDCMAIPLVQEKP
jgi:hypothetical protein